MIITGPIESFFKIPGAEPSSEGDGVLFHLRRDLVKLLGPENQHTKDAAPHLMLSIMGLLAGIDYLSRVYSSAKESRGRFAETIKDLYNVTEDDSQAIYQLRCAIIHTVALSTISDCSHRRGIRFNFEIAGEYSFPLIEKMSDDPGGVTYRICFGKLREAFLHIVAELEAIARDVAHPKNSHVVNMIGQMHSEKILKSE